MYVCLDRVQRSVCFNAIVLVEAHFVHQIGRGESEDHNVEGFAEMAVVIDPFVTDFLVVSE
ncbi:hypothetical protein Svir_21480 [Saccharomonospora viridis DSM 43017]|uniref:Uncharacterized protein n=1 Tax=Saccharomonospora viridis (strain ATCC 15386 / DSM 43017 / JCM 3036 / CCUG 5913 / NBRC 12207 / NCIMB 9602 / P101) TaxID=471857 RepID=C7MWQ5_SACVD|nr:hypothetical protein Svir_21480 [Saccharomonospora viridis DSM 43017]